MSKKLQAILQQTYFETTVAKLDQLPRRPFPEVAFIGRSNAGKSTAINLITQQTRLAFASKTPGRTQHLNFFAVPRSSKEKENVFGYLVDLPGYGFASSAKWVKDDWDGLIGGYLQHRENLSGVVVLMDIRHPMLPIDLSLLDWLADCNKGSIPILILLTKCDKLNQQEKIETQRRVQNHLSLLPLLTNIQVELFSAPKRIGLSPALLWLSNRLKIAI
jgi:GTP-binding protein